MVQSQEKMAKNRERSVAYPSIALGDAIEFTEQLRKSLGNGPYSRQEAAKALGHGALTGPAARKVAALTHYGLLERDGNAYNLSSLALEITMPTSAEEKEKSIKRAAVMPRLFHGLCQKFNNQGLPILLANILVREKVSMSASDEVARIFTETMKFSGILVNGVIINPPIQEQEDSKNDSLPRNPSPEVSNSQFALPRPGFVDDVFDFKLTGGIRLVIPRTKETSEAIADGELKDIRQALRVFSQNFLQLENDKTEAESREEEAQPEYDKN